MKLPTNQLEIIILNYNTADLVAGQLADLYHQNWQITIVDNQSSKSDQNKLDRLIQKYPKVKLIKTKANLGFAKGNNLALRNSKAEYVLLLNSDVIIKPEAIKKTLGFLIKTSSAGAVTLALYLDKAKCKLDWACHRGFPTPWAALTYFTGLEKLLPKIDLFSRYHLKTKNMTKPHQLDAISGAFFLARRRALAQVGFFDEDFFMYGEDIDLCVRLKSAGWQIWFYPDAQAIHLKHQAGLKSQKRGSKNQSRRYFFEAMELFYQKHYADTKPGWFNFIIKTSIKVLKLSLFKR